jgi:hypothetical protein
VKKKVKYKIGSHVKWTTDINCVKIYNGKTHKLGILQYPEAALWDLISQQYSMHRMTSIMAAITGKDTAEIRGWIKRTMDEWSAQKIVEQ